ncbi:flagellar biosynthetic protein FliR [Chryseomicrobium aureum]|uniref:flagellar biosynthetic protein FliR n=1 Tax=Chryseomicrobium aureum TaxID=1441723 RepID=UPI00195C402A|nr:flagellar biosynthetic protein FliR [Chryseomicrobium aureum]MBM7705966.1 flagellar biosynthetic protein FliR [Chryseomicrobium aureum]
MTWDEAIASFPYFLLVLIRMSAFFLIAPIFSQRNIPTQLKIGLAVFLALLTTTVVPTTEPFKLDGYYTVLIFKELVIGLSLGFLAAMILYMVQVAGAFIDFQMGFALANVIDPQTGSQVPIIGQFKYILAILFLLAINGHHLLINGMLHSVALVPVGTRNWLFSAADLSEFFVTVFAAMFVIAFQLALPIVGSLFLVDAALGLLAKTVPQMNIFAVGFPLKIGVGFILLLILMPSFFFLLQRIVERIGVLMNDLMRILGG